jgi:sterol desaturase/sphingolipid hydroxylase (fatty acid hydroxylase superfamily)
MEETLTKKEEQPVLYSTQPFEWLSRYREINTMLIWIMYGMVVAAFIYLTVQKGMVWWLAALLFIAGAVTWTISEYILHRYALHFVRDSELSKRWHHFVHGKHHDIPRDLTFVTASPFVTIGPGLLFFAAFFLILGNTYIWPFYAGFGFGYMLYELTHHAIHKISKPPKPLRNLWQNHLLHHYQTPEKRFGVTNTFWDKIFGTEG